MRATTWSSASPVHASQRCRGLPLNGQIYVVYTLRDGRIVRMDDYLSRAEAIAAAGATVKDWA
jgi:ketosteroid isomerase-like protein